MLCRHWFCHSLAGWRESSSCPPLPFLSNVGEARVFGLQSDAARLPIEKESAGLWMRPVRFFLIRRTTSRNMADVAENLDCGPDTQSSRQAGFPFPYAPRGPLTGRKCLVLFPASVGATSQRWPRPRSLRLRPARGIDRHPKGPLCFSSPCPPLTLPSPLVPVAIPSFQRSSLRVTPRMHTHNQCEVPPVRPPTPMFAIPIPTGLVCLSGEAVHDGMNPC